MAVRIMINETCHTLAECIEKIRNHVGVEQKKMLDADILELRLRRMLRPEIRGYFEGYNPEQKYKISYNKIELIKEYRSATGMGLKESKDFIEAMFGY